MTCHFSNPAVLPWVSEHLCRENSCTRNGFGSLPAGLWLRAGGCLTVEMPAPGWHCDTQVALEVSQEHTGPEPGWARSVLILIQLLKGPELGLGLVFTPILLIQFLLVRTQLVWEEPVFNTRLGFAPCVQQKVGFCFLCTTPGWVLLTEYSTRLGLL